MHGWANRLSHDLIRLEVLLQGGPAQSELDCLEAPLGQQGPCLRCEAVKGDQPEATGVVGPNLARGAAEEGDKRYLRLP